MSIICRLGFLGVLLGVFATLPGHAQGPAPGERRVAFLVGVNEYQNNGFKTLSWAENDVVEMEKELRRIGFDQVVTLTASLPGEKFASRANIKRQLDLLLKDVHKQDLVLVMLSGHGQLLRARGLDGKERMDAFFCPVDAVEDKPETMVSLSWLTDDELRVHAGRNLLLVDACRANVIIDRDKGVNSKGIDGRVITLPEGIAILFSCSFGQISIERGDLKHGIFTYCVLNSLRAGGGPITLSKLISDVEEQMAGLNPKQEPMFAGHASRLVLGTRGGAQKSSGAREPRTNQTNNVSAEPNAAREKTDGPTKTEAAKVKKTDPDRKIAQPPSKHKFSFANVEYEVFSAERHGNNWTLVLTAKSVEPGGVVVFQKARVITKFGFRTF